MAMNLSSQTRETGASRWALPILLFGAAMTGAAPIFVRYSELGPLGTGFWRMALALPALTLWLALAGKRADGGSGRRRLPPVAWLLLFAAGAAYGGDLAFWNASITLTSVANATLLVNLAPVFVVAAAWLIWRERIGRRVVLGLALALAGAALLVGDGFGLDGEHLRGDAFAVVTAAFYASYLLFLRQALSDADAGRAMLISGAFAALVLLALVLVAGEPLVPHGWSGWWPLLGLALVCQVAGQGLIAVGLPGLGAGPASIGLMAQPVAAAVLGWIVLGEALSALQLAGGAVVLGGVLLVREGRAPEAASAPVAPADAAPASLRARTC